MCVVFLGRWGSKAHVFTLPMTLITLSCSCSILLGQKLYTTLSKYVQFVHATVSLISRSQVVCVLYFLLTVLHHSLDVEGTLLFCSHSFQAAVCIIIEHTHAKLNLHIYNPEIQDGGGGV